MIAPATFLDVLSVEVTCCICQKSFVILVPAIPYMLWRYMNIGCIQDVMPELSADERELLISKTCGKCFDNLFGGVDEDE